MASTLDEQPDRGIDAKSYDEESIDWDRGRTPSLPLLRRSLRMPRLRRTSLVLFLVDLIVTLLVIRAFEPLITLLVKNEELFGARLTLDPHLPPPNTDAADHDAQIPRILHQTSATAIIPEKWSAAQKSCRDVYADWKYMHWTDDSARDFLEAQYPWFLETWDNYPYPIIRADAIRYFVLYHYGGLYLDMDTLCTATIPVEQIETMPAKHHAVFKSTKPTGVSNDLMISSKGHPLFLATISQLISFNDLAKPLALLLPYVAIMIAAGPMMVTLVIKNYLLGQPSLPPATAQVINATQLEPFLTDLESASWHKGDAQALMFIGDRPWIWFVMGAVGWVFGLHIINRLLMLAIKGLDRVTAGSDDEKIAKLT